MTVLDAIAAPRRPFLAAQTQAVLDRGIEIDRWVRRHKGGFHRVLVDAVCFGTGTWRRNPDARWWSEGFGLDTLLPLQAKILASAALLVRPGGRLDYATCSLLGEENEAQVEGFMAAFPGWRVVPVGEVAEGVGSAHAEYLALTPARHGTDGLFAAGMERRGVPDDVWASSTH